MSRIILFSLLLLPLMACPEPQGNDIGQPGDPAAGGAPPMDGTAPPPGTGGGGTPMGGPPPGFASLVTDGKTVTISGVVNGATKAQIDFTTIAEREGQKVPNVIEVVQTTDGTFKVSAPAVYDGDIWVTATVDAAGDGPTPDDKGGVAAEAIKLSGTDVIVEVTITDDAEWFKKLPWYVDPAAVAAFGTPSAGVSPGAGGETPAGGAPPADGAAPTAPAGDTPPAP